MLKYRITKVCGYVADALVCAQTPTQASIAETYNAGGWHARMEAGFRLLSRVAPRFSAFAARKCLRSVDVAGVDEATRPIARGRSATVFLTSSTNRVVKVFRQSAGISPAGRKQYFEMIERSMAHMNHYYGHCCNLMVPTTLEYVSSPILGYQSVALVQEFVDIPFTDFFLDHTDEELVSLMSDYPALRKQFVEFAENTHQSLLDGRFCFDMYGKDNLMLTSEMSGPRLLIADLGVYDLDERERNKPHVYEGILQRHERLFGLYKTVCGKELKPID